MAEGDEIQTCSNNGQLSVWTLLISAFGKDSSGQFYLRTVGYEQEAGEESAISCDSITGGEMETLEMLLRGSIVENSEGKPALRLGTVWFVHVGV